VTTHANATAANAATPAAAVGAAVPDYSEVSERILLACALDENRRTLLNRMLSVLANDDFHLEQHKLLWSCLRTLNENSLPHDAVAVLDYSTSRGMFVGGVEYLMALCEDALGRSATDEAVEGAATRVKEFSTLRRLSALMQQGQQLCASGRNATDVLGVIEDDLRNLRKMSESSRNGPEHVRGAISDVLATVDRQMDGEQIQAISTGHPELDALIYGFTDGDLIVLAARPSMGKTAGAMDLSRHIGMRMGTPQERKVLFFSTEMQKEALARRALAREGRIDLGTLRSGQLNDSDIGRLSEAAGMLEQSGIYIDDEPGLSLAELRARSRAFVSEHGKCVIVVDYLQNLAAPEGVETRSHVGLVSNGLKGLARELGVPVIALSQLNRGLEQRANKRPVMSDLRESGNIEQDADVIMFLYRDEVYNPDTKEPGICEWIIGKQRDGAIGTVKLGFEKTTGLYYSLDHGGGY
jgi:replicative DNA helicase